MSEGGHDGAWYCSQTKDRAVCPQQGCPKGHCEREHGWLPGLPEPDHYTSTPPATQADDADLLDEIAEAISDTLDMDWQPSWAAPNILALINRERAAAHAAGRAAERADVVAWLRTEAGRIDDLNRHVDAHLFADAIERGQHKEQKP